LQIPNNNNSITACLNKLLFPGLSNEIMIERKMKKSSLLHFVLISLLAMIIYSSVSVRPAVAADPDPCWGNGKCLGSSCSTIDVISGKKETCKWNDSQGVQWSQTCSIHLTKGSGSTTEVTLNGCDESFKTGTSYAPPPQSNLSSPVNDTGNTTLPLASIFKNPIQPETNNSAVNNTSTLPTLTINKEKNNGENGGNATNQSNNTSILKSSHKSGGHHHHNNKESKINASTNSSESQNSQAVVP
jgi:hypothetical protein